MSANTKLVNGKRINLTLEEAAEIEAEWESNAVQPSDPPVRDLLVELNDLKTRIEILETELLLNR